MWRRTVFGLVAVLLLIGGGVTGYWYVVCRRLEDGFATWARAQAPAWRVHATATRFAGWPIAAILVVPNVRISGGEGIIPGGMSWRAESMRLVVRLLQPEVLNICPEGEQRIGPAVGPGLPYHTAQTRIWLRLWPDTTPRHIQLASVALRADGEFAIGEIHARVALDPSAAAAQPAIDVRLDAERIDLPRAVNWPLGRQLSDFSLDGAIEGPLPPAHDFTDEAKAWRDGGGAVALRRVALRWGPLDGRLVAQVALDGALQPMAHGRAVVTGYAATLDVLAARRVISDDAALAAKGVLSLLAVTPDDGGAPQVDVPFELRDRLLSIHGIPLVKVPPAEWPAP